MSVYRITHVRVESPGTHEQHIYQVKLHDGSIETREQAYDYIKSGHDYYYTTGGGYRADVEPVTNQFGTKYIRTKPDATTRDNLLSLPRF